MNWPNLTRILIIVTVLYNVQVVKLQLVQVNTNNDNNLLADNNKNQDQEITNLISNLPTNNSTAATNGLISQSSVPAAAAIVNSSVNLVPIGPSIQLSNDAEKFEEFKRSKYFVPPFEPKMIKLPPMQKEYVENVVAVDSEYYRQILREAIEMRHSFAASARLMFKNSAKLLGKCIKNRQGEQKLKEHYDAKPAYFLMIADMAQKIIDRSAVLKKEKQYNQKSVDTGDLYRRFDNLLNWLQSTIIASPVAHYLRLNETIIFRNELKNPNHDKSLCEEAADLLAQFRGMGYESCIFVAKRIINLLNMFSRGLVPSVEQV